MQTFDHIATHDGEAYRITGKAEKAGNPAYPLDVVVEARIARLDTGTRAGRLVAHVGPGRMFWWPSGMEMSDEAIRRQVPTPALEALMLAATAAALRVEV